LAERDRLKALAYRFIKDPDAAEDLVQETIIRAWHAREQFASGTGLRAWLNTILRNKYFSDLRRAKLGDKISSVLAADIDYVECHGASAVDAEVLAKLFRDLPEGQREVIQGLSSGESYEACAERLQIAVGTVKSRAWRAREALSK